VWGSESCGSSRDARPSTYMQETHDKAQSRSNLDKLETLNNDKVQNPNEKKEQFWHSSIGVSIVIGILTFGICWGLP
jgi:hypothetical protein